MSQRKRFRIKFKRLGLGGKHLSKLGKLVRRPRVGGKAVVLTLLLLLVAVTSVAVYISQIPSTRALSANIYNYQHIADYRYAAYLRPNVLYNTTILPQGEPMYLSLVKSLRVVLDYRVSGAEIRSGKAVLTVRLVDPGRWDKTIYSENILFDDGFKWSYDVNLTETSELASLIRREISVTTSRYDIVFSADIKSSVNANGYLRTDTITPSLVLTVDQGSSMITARESGELLPLEESRTTYSPVYLEPFPLGMFGWSVEASDLKLYVYTAIPIITALTIVAWGMLWPKALEKGEAEVLKERYGDLMIDLADPPEVGGAVANVESMDDLARISASLGKPILHYNVDGKHYYMVLDGGSAYRYGVGNGDT